MLPATKAEAIAAFDEVQGSFGAAGDEVVIEKRLEGREVSVFALTDGENVVCLPPAQDYKRALDYDQGLNTGGMGAICPVEVLREGFAARIFQCNLIGGLKLRVSRVHPLQREAATKAEIAFRFVEIVHPRLEQRKATQGRSCLV